MQYYFISHLQVITSICLSDISIQLCRYTDSTLRQWEHFKLGFLKAILIKHNFLLMNLAIFLSLFFFFFFFLSLSNIAVRFHVPLIFKWCWQEAHFALLFTLQNSGYIFLFYIFHVNLLVFLPVDKIIPDWINWYVYWYVLIGMS